MATIYGPDGKRYALADYFEMFESYSLEECLHYDKDPLWTPCGFDERGRLVVCPTQVCGSCYRILDDAATIQREREDAALEERVRRQTRQQVAQEILEYRPLYTTRTSWLYLSGPEVYQNTKEIMSRLAWWPPVDEKEEA